MGVDRARMIWSITRRFRGSASSMESSWRMGVRVLISSMMEGPGLGVGDGSVGVMVRVFSWIDY